MVSGMYQISVNVKFLHFIWHLACIISTNVKFLHLLSFCCFIKSNPVAMTVTAHHNFKVPHMYSYHIIILFSHRLSCTFTVCQVRRHVQESIGFHTECELQPTSLLGSFIKISYEVGEPSSLYPLFALGLRYRSCLYRSLVSTK